MTCDSGGRQELAGAASADEHAVKDATFASGWFRTSKKYVWIALLLHALRPAMPFISFAPPQTLFSPGSAATTPHLFTQRQPLFAAASPRCGASSHQQQHQPADDRVKARLEEEGAWQSTRLIGTILPGSGALTLPLLPAWMPQVVVRIRPPAPGREAGEPLCVLHTGVDTLTLQSSPEATYFTLDHVAGPGTSQEHMFKVRDGRCTEPSV